MNKTSVWLLGSALCVSLAAPAMASDTIKLKYDSKMTNAVGHKEGIAYSHGFQSGLSLAADYTRATEEITSTINEATTTASYSLPSSSIPQLKYSGKVQFKHEMPQGTSYNVIQETVGAKYTFSDFFAMQADYRRSDDLSQVAGKALTGSNRVDVKFSFSPAGSSVSYFVTPLYTQSTSEEGSGFGGKKRWEVDAGLGWTVDRNQSVGFKYVHYPRDHWRLDSESENKDYAEITWSYKFS